MIVILICSKGLAVFRSQWGEWPSTNCTTPTLCGYLPLFIGQCFLINLTKASIRGFLRRGHCTHSIPRVMRTSLPII